jgi:hypothetical protein
MPSVVAADHRDQIVVARGEHQRGDLRLVAELGEEETPQP